MRHCPNSKSYPKSNDVFALWSLAALRAIWILPSLYLSTSPPHHPFPTPFPKSSEMDWCPLLALLQIPPLGTSTTASQQNPRNPSPMLSESITTVLIKAVSWKLMSFSLISSLFTTSLLQKQPNIACMFAPRDSTPNRYHGYKYSSCSAPLLLLQIPLHHGPFHQKLSTAPEMNQKPECPRGMSASSSIWLAVKTVGLSSSRVCGGPSRPISHVQHPLISINLFIKAITTFWCDCYLLVLQSRILQ